MSSAEEFGKSAADFHAERDVFFMRQSANKKLLAPRITAVTSAKAASEEEERLPESTPKVDVSETVNAVMEALNTVGEDAKKHLTEEDKKFIKNTCLSDDSQGESSNLAFFIIIALIIGVLIGKKM